MLEATSLALRSRPRLVLVLIALAAYATSLSGPFQFDDYWVIVNYAPVHSLAAWWASLGHGLRPLLKLTYAVNWSLGLGAAGFHLFNLAVHLANVELVLRLYAAASHPGERWPFGRIDSGGFAAGLLFAVHPVQTEAVAYVSGRSSSLMTFFMLLAVLFYAEGVRSGRARFWLGLAPAAFACAFLTKETAAILPASLLLWEACIERTRLRALLARQAAWWILLSGVLAWAIMQQSYFALLYRMTGERSLFESLRYQIAGVGYLLSRLVFVNRLSIDPGLGLAPPGPAVLFAAGAMTVLLLVVALAQVRTRPLMAFGVLWFLLHAFFPFAITPRADVINERHMYLANAGLFMALGSLCSELVNRPTLRHGARRLVTAAGVLLIFLLAVATALRNLDYRSEIALWQSTARVSSSNPRAHNNLGIAYESKGLLAEARDEYARAVLLEPRYGDARRNLERLARRESRGR